MARQDTVWSGPSIKRLRVLAEPGVMTIQDLAAEFQRSRRAIKAKLAELGITAPDQEGGKERKCMNHSVCGNTFVSKYAGLCPKCRNQPSPSRFETPAAFV